MADQDTTGGKDLAAGSSADAKRITIPSSIVPALAGDAANPSYEIPPSPSGELGNDIAQILKAVKLPERHDSTGGKRQFENKAALFDTTLGVPAQAGAAGEQPAAPTPIVVKPPVTVVPPPVVQKPVAPIVTPPSLPPTPKPVVTPVSEPVVPKPVVTTPPSAPVVVPPSAPMISKPVVTVPPPALPAVPKTAPVSTPLPGIQKPSTPTPAQAVAPKIAQTAVPAAVPNAPKPPESSVAAVHTLKNDLQQAVQEQNISTVRAVALEEDRRAKDQLERPEMQPSTRRSNRTFSILFSVVIFLLLGAGALFGVYTYMQSSSAAAPQTQTTSSILFAESSVAFPLDNQTPDDVKRALAAARSSVQGALGSITRIVPTTAAASADGTTTGVRPATFAEFMQALGANPPDSLIRALGTNFFFGIHTVDTNAPLIVVPVSSYDRAFAGMLTWESTMNAGLAPVFTAVSATTRDKNGLPMNRVFEDSVLRNYDIRELNDDTGQTRLYYSFPSQNILVIAESPYSFAEILSRLQAQREL